MPTGTEPGVDLLASALAAISALIFAVASNLQRHAASRVPISDGGAVRLFLRLLRVRRWLAGSLLALGGLALHAMALGRGGVILVQAIMACGLIAALGVEAWTERRRLGRGEVAGSLLCIAGVVAVLGIGHPGAGREVDTTVQLWSAGILLVVATVGFTMSRLHHRISLSAVVMGAVAGACFAIDAVYLKGIANWTDQVDLLPAATTATGFVVASLCGNVIVQRAYQRAPLRLVLPAVTVGDPLSAFAIGRGLLGEHLQGGPGAGTAVTLGLLAMTAGIIVTSLHNPHRDQVGEPAMAAPGDLPIVEPDRMP